MMGNDGHILHQLGRITRQTHMLFENVKGFQTSLILFTCPKDTKRTIPRPSTSPSPNPTPKINAKTNAYKLKSSGSTPSTNRKLAYKHGTSTNKPSANSSPTTPSSPKTTSPLKHSSTVPNSSSSKAKAKSTSGKSTGNNATAGESNSTNQDRSTKDSSWAMKSGEEPLKSTPIAIYIWEISSITKSMDKAPSIGSV